MAPPRQQQARRNNPAAEPEAEGYGGVSDYGGHRVKLQLKTLAYLIPLGEVKVKLRATSLEPMAGIAYNDPLFITLR